MSGWHLAAPAIAFEPAALIAFGAGAVIAAAVIPLLIVWQRRRSLGQQVYEDGPSSHAVKAGTPTMGGVTFALAAVAGAIMSLTPLWPAQQYVLPLLALVLAAALIGFADDYVKLIRRRPLGLRARAKFGALVVVAIAFVVWQAQAEPAHDQLWFGSMQPLHLPTWLWAALSVCAIVGAANAVNLSDGLDGLAAGAAIPPLLLLQWVSAWSLIPAAVVGSCVGFLFYNRHPARIFMGDTGSLALGALMGGLAIQSHWLLLLPFAAAVFVAEALSVILQVASFKLTGKRIFKMTPLHHHFEMIGWPEQRVTFAFVAASWVAALLTWIPMMPAAMRGVFN